MELFDEMDLIQEKDIPRDDKKEPTVDPVTDNPEKLINNLVADRNSCFVFPSEIAADRAMKIALKSVEAVERSRFLSWDRFKEQFLSQQEADRRPVSRLDLLFFCSSIAEENKKTPFLTSVIRTEYSNVSPAMLSLIEQAMESLFLLEPGYEELGTALLRRDLSALKNRFEIFKEKEKLFEAGIPDSIDINDGMQYYIIFPQLILDIDEYRYHLEGLSSVTFVEGENTLSDDFQFQYYDNEQQELNSLMLKLRDLLKKDPSADILITSADSSTTSLLRFYSARYGVPLDFRMGDKLSDRRESLFFSKMRDAVSNQFQFETMRAFFLHHSPSWNKKTADFNRKILRAGSEGFVLQDKKEWDRAIYSAGKNISKDERVDIQRYFKRICGLMREIVHASDFKTLRSSIQTLTASYLDEKGLVGSARRSFETVINKLKELDEKSANLQSLDAGSPFSLWMQYLNRSLYVAKSDGGGVPVYDYRVTGGCFPDYHFICGLNQKSSAVIVSSAPLLSDPEKELWTAASKKELSTDFSEAFLSAYPFCGDQVFISGCEEMGGRVQSPPLPWLLGKNIKRIKGNGQNTPLFLSQQDRDGALLYFERQRGLDNASSIPAHLRPLNNPSLISLLKQRRSKEGRLRLSATSMENFRKCPWRALSDSIFGNDYGKELNVSNPGYEGELIHNFLSELYSNLKESQIHLSPLNHEEILEIIDRVHQSYFSLIEEKSGRRPVKAQWNRLKKSALLSAKTLISKEIKEFPDTRITDCEIGIQAEWGDTLLYGRIDRVSRNGMKILILDYKRTLKVRKTDLLPTQKEEDSEYESISPLSVQMPLYYYLVSQSELLSGVEDEGVAALYYDLKKQRFARVCDPGYEKSWFSSDEIEGLAATLLQTVEKLALSIDKGDYMIPDEPECEYCSRKSFCRYFYALTAKGANNEI